MRIPLSAPDVREADLAAVGAVLRGRRLSLGERLGEFERGLAEHAGVAQAVAMNSGSSALFVALRALGIGPGDEVIVPSFAFVAVANAVVWAGAAPVFAEIDPRTLTLDPGAVEMAASPRTRAILAVHTFGCPADLGALAAIAARRRLPLVEDACEALGAEYRGAKVGSLGAAGVFAFYPNKQITTGEGGALVTSDAPLAAKARALRNQGRGDGADWLGIEEPGYSFRLPEMSCALGAEQLKRIEGILRRREEIVRSYERGLAGNPRVELPISGFPDRRVSWFTYPVRLAPGFTREDRDAAMREMAARGIECGRYFPPLHWQPAFRAARRAGDLALTESVASRSLALPLFNQITEAQIGEVCEALGECLPRRSARRQPA